MELVCPAGSLPAFTAALEAGADAIYLGFRDATNARHFAGLNFDEAALRTAFCAAKARGVRVFVAINTYPQTGNWPCWEAAVDKAAELGADAIIAADVGLLDYARRQHSQLPRHLSVQASATHPDALNFYHEHLGVKRVVLPRVLSLKQVQSLAAVSPVALEVFAFGALCIMAEGRCYLSSWLTGQSPNNCGVCSPAEFVQWQETPQGTEARLNGYLIDRYGPHEQAGYPTLCKGRFWTAGKLSHSIEEPTSLNTLALIPDLHRMGIAAIKIEGRQRSPAYVSQVVKIWRQALDCYQFDPVGFQVKPHWMQGLSRLSEGAQTTLGAYARRWQ